MKVISLSTHDQVGGAAIAAQRLHLACRQEGINSLMMVADKTGGDPHTIGIHNNFTYSLRRNLERIPLLLEKSKEAIGWQSLAWLPNPSLISRIKKEAPDLIHLHWVQNGYFPLRQLPALNCPLVWTFHDLWPVCGEFHLEFGKDQRNTERYSSSNRPDDRSGVDLDRWVWKTKERIYPRLTLEAVVPSRWMAEQVRNSQLWRDREVHVIPNGLDLSIFKPIDRTVARNIFNLPTDKTLILFGAMFAGVDRNKGYPELRQALEHLSLPRETTELVVFGMSEPAPNEKEFPFVTNFLGVLRDPQLLACLYSAADLMVVPSLQESFGQTASEPMACGTPCVAFDTSGLKDIIDHEDNGYLASPFDPADFARGIHWVLENKERYLRLCEAARQKATETFDARKVARQHREVYELAIDRHRS